MKQKRNTIQDSYKKVFYFRQLFNELINLSYFTEEISNKDRDRIVILGEIMDKELNEEQGIVNWFKRNHKLVWDAFLNKTATECQKILTENQRIIYNQLGYVKYVSQWWESDDINDTQPSSKFLDYTSMMSEGIEKNYYQYSKELNNKKD